MASYRIFGDGDEAAALRLHAGLACILKGYEVTRMRLRSMSLDEFRAFVMTLRGAK